MVKSKASFLLIIVTSLFGQSEISAQTEAWPQFARSLDYRVWFSDDRPATDSMTRIEGGDYTLGSPENSRKIHLEPFFILRHEVCNKQYLEFLDSTDHAAPVIDPISEGTWPVNQIFGWRGRSYPPGRAGFPVTGISFEDAEAFCEWRSQVTGFLHRLPTEDEWEAAYRGKERRSFPWGSDWSSQKIIALFRSPEVGPDPFYASTYDETPLRILHLLGNVREIATVSYPRPRPVTHVICGLSYDFNGGPERDSASWSHTPIPDVNLGSKAPKDFREYNVGFRYVIPITDGRPASRVR